MDIVEVKNICKTYQSFQMKDVSFSLEEGRITGFIGRNGAGKSTTIKAMLNLIHTDSGKIFYFGMPLAGNEAMAVHPHGGLVFGGLQSFGRTIPADCGTVARLWNIDLDRSSETCPGRVHRLYDPGCRTRDHRRSCRDSGRIIRFYLVVTRKTE